MTSPLIEVESPRGTFSIPEKPEPHTLHNMGPGGIALIYNPRTDKERRIRVQPNAHGDNGHHMTSDWVFLEWIKRDSGAENDH